MERGKIRRAITTILLISLVFSATNTLVEVRARTYSFTATMSPTEVDVDQTITYSVTITNIGSSTLGSASIAIPAGFTVLSGITILTPPSSWNYTLSNVAINLTGSTGGAAIHQGESVIFTFDAVTPPSPGVTAWAAEATTSIGGGGTALELDGAQPTVTVNPLPVAPTISASPDTINQGQTSLLLQPVVTSGGTLPYTYQWLESFDGGPFSPITGASGSSYTFSTTTSSAIGIWSFRLNVTDSSGVPVTVTSNLVNVIVNSALAAPTVTATPNAVYPTQVSILASSPVTTGTSPYTFQWFQRPPNDDYTTVGDNSPSYTFPGSTTIGTWAFLLQVTDSTGASINSSSVEVIVSSTPVFTITVTQGPHGTINPETSSVALGGSQSFIISPDTGYHVADVLVDGTSVGAVTSYTFTDVTESHTISVTFEIDLYIIDASAGPNGTINPAGTIVVNWNATQSFTIAPDPNYHITDVLVDGVSVGPAASYTFTGVASNHNITANFAIGTYYFINVISAHGSPTPSTQVNAGGSLTVSVTDPEGDTSHRWICTGYSIDGGAPASGTSYTFTNIQADHTITFNWQEQYHLTVISPGSSTTGAGWYNTGTTATVSVTGNTITSDNGIRQVFTGWTGDATGTDTTSNPITIDSPKTATANWKIQYYLNVTSDYGNPTGQGWYDAGTTATFSVNTPVSGSPDTRNIFDSWTGTSGAYTGTAASSTVTMNYPITEKATWTTQYQVTYATSGNVLQVTAPPTEWVNSGAPATTPFPTSIINSAGNTRSIFVSDNRPNAITAPITITGTYQTQYLVTFSQNGLDSDASGTVVTVLGDTKAYEQLPNNAWIDTGGSVTFSYAATVESTKIGKKYILTRTNSTSPLIINEPTTIQGDYEPQASSTLNLNTIVILAILVLIPALLTTLLLAWRRRKKKITPVANAGGVISPSTTQRIERGGDSTVFIITADSGYEIADVVIDNAIHLGAVRTYKFINVNENHTISAIFHKI